MAVTLISYLWSGLPRNTLEGDGSLNKSCHLSLKPSGFLLQVFVIADHDATFLASGPSCRIDTFKQRQN